MSETSIVVTFDKKLQKIKFFRIENDILEKAERTFVTEVKLDHLRSLPIEEACRITGENIFIFLEETRNLLE